MNAPTAKDIKEINYDIQLENSSQKIKLSIINSSNNLLVTISNSESLIQEEYSKSFSIEDLIKLGKYFKVFEDIEKVMEGLKETF